MNNNFSSSPERRQVYDVSAVNKFLTRMYSIMGVAVLVSALSAYLTMTVFRSAVMHMPAAMFWVVLFVPLFLCMGISFKAGRNPGLGFTLLMILSIIYGFEFALIAGYFTGTTIAAAFVSAAAIFGSMALFGTFTKKDLSNWGAYLTAALIGFIVAWAINAIFLHSLGATFIFSIIGVVIFTGLVAYDAHNAKNIYLTYGSQVSDSGLAIMGALNMYLDFVNIFMFLLEIFGINGNRR